MLYHLMLYHLMKKIYVYIYHPLILKYEESRVNNDYGHK